MLLETDVLYIFPKEMYVCSYKISYFIPYTFKSEDKFIQTFLCFNIPVVFMSLTISLFPLPLPLFHLPLPLSPPQFFMLIILHYLFSPSFPVSQSLS